MDSDVTRFSLPVAWDRATEVLKHAARNGQTAFEIVRLGNGYMQLAERRAFHHRTTIDVFVLTEGLDSTIVVATDVTRRSRVSRRGSYHRARALLARFQSDAELFVRLLAQHTSLISQPGVPDTDPAPLVVRASHRADRWRRKAATPTFAPAVMSTEPA